LKKNLLLLHGALGSKDQFNKLESLLDENYNIYKFNFSGHGGLEIPISKFSIKLFSEDLTGFIEKNKLSEVNIFGYSMGGYVALYTSANTEINNPNQIKKIFTLATKFDWNPTSSAKETKFLNPDVIEEKVPKFADVLKARHSDNNWRKVLIKTAEMMTDLGNNPELTDNDLSEINIPVLISVGDSDNMVSVDESKYVSGKIKNCEFKILENTQHPIEKTDVEILAKEIKNFIN